MAAGWPPSRYHPTAPSFLHSAPMPHFGLQVMCGSAFLTMLCVIVILPAIRKARLRHVFKSRFETGGHVDSDSIIRTQGKFSEAKSALDARVVSKDKSVDEDQRGNDPIENQSGRSSCKCWKLTLQYQLVLLLLGGSCLLAVSHFVF